MRAYPLIGPSLTPHPKAPAGHSHVYAVHEHAVFLVIEPGFLPSPAKQISLSIDYIFFDVTMFDFTIMDVTLVYGFLF